MDDLQHSQRGFVWVHCLQDQGLGMKVIKALFRISAFRRKTLQILREIYKNDFEKNGFGAYEKSFKALTFNICAEGGNEYDAAACFILDSFSQLAQVTKLMASAMKLPNAGVQSPKLNPAAFEQQREVFDICVKNLNRCSLVSRVLTALENTSRDYGMEDSYNRNKIGGLV